MEQRIIKATDLPKSCCHLDGKNSYFLSTEVLLKSHHPHGSTSEGTLIFTRDSSSEPFVRTGYANSSIGMFSDAEWFDYVIHCFY